MQLVYLHKQSILQQILVRFYFHPNTYLHISKKSLSNAISKNAIVPFNDSKAYSIPPAADTMIAPLLEPKSLKVFCINSKLVLAFTFWLYSL
jgi:hypothetical protein